MEALTPRPNNVILESFPDDLRGAPLMSDSKIVAPGQYAETSRLAKVISVGKDVDSLVPGDVVLCNRYPASAQSFKFYEREFVSVNIEEILARVTIDNNAKAN